MKSEHNAKMKGRTREGHQIMSLNEEKREKMLRGRDA